MVQINGNKCGLFGIRMFAKAPIRDVKLPLQDAE